MPNQLAKSMHEIAKQNRLAQRGPTNADRFRAMSDKEIVEFLASVFCAGMSAEERGDDFLHSFPWTLDRIRQPAEDGQWH